MSFSESQESLLFFISIKILMSPKKSPWASWVSISLAETHESPVVSLRLISPQESLRFSWVLSSLPECHDSPLVSRRDSWGLFSLNETTGDSWVSARLMDTHDAQGDFLGLMRILILIKNKRDSWDSEQTTGDWWDSNSLLWTHETHENHRLMGTHETHESQAVFLSLMRLH